MTKNIVGVVVWLAGVGATMAAIEGQSMVYWGIAPLLLLLSSFVAIPRLTRVLAGMSVILVLAWLIARAGPLTSLTPREWLWMLALAVLLFVLVAGPGWLWRSGRRAFAVLVAVAVLPAVSLQTMWIANQVSPVLLNSQYVTMRDGVRIAIDVYLPRDLGSAEKIPTALHQTRYHRNPHWLFPYSLIVPPWKGGADRLTAARIAWVKVDVRGSGASEGGRPIAFSELEIRDGAAIVDWIVAQPWSDGSVIGEGVSYVGTTAEYLLANRHPAVKASMPTFALYDGYRDIVWPGGLFLSRFVETWTLLNTSLDSNEPERALKTLAGKTRGVRPTDSDRGGRNLAEIVRNRTNNYVPAELFPHLEFADSEFRGLSLNSVTSWRHHEDITTSRTPMFMVSGWYDGAYPNGAIRRMLNTPNPGSRLLIGPWDHGGRQVITPCADDAGATRFDYFGELIDLINHAARGEENGFSRRAPITYFTMCGAGWQSANRWPPAGMTERRLYFSTGQKLLDADPAQGLSHYTVDFDVNSAHGSRWISYTNLEGLRIAYPDRAEQDKRLLVFDSAPFSEGIEITGHPVVTLHMAANDVDAAVFVYLEDVGEAGDVRYITEGQIRAAHRHISSEPLPFRQIGVNRSFKREDLRPLTPGEPFVLEFDLLPTSYFLRPGRKLRIAIAGADKSHFRLPENAASEFIVYSGGDIPTSITLPVRGKR